MRVKISKENGNRIVRLEGKEVAKLEAAIEICRELGDENGHIPANTAAGALGQLIEKFGPKKKAAAAEASTEADDKETESAE